MPIFAQQIEKIFAEDYACIYINYITKIKFLMRTKTIFNYVVAALFCCCVTGMVTSCQSLVDTGSADNPSAENMIKQGVWTEYDTAFSASGKYTEEELEEMPAVGMMVEGDKAYFFTYLSEETMEFEFTYEGKKVTGSCAWLCDNLDNWGTADESDWKELEPYYQAIAETAGPDASIDWSGSETVTVEEVDEEGNIVEKEVTVTDLDKPLVWNTGASSRGGTRMVTAVIEGISAGLEIFTSLFEPDPMEEINAKLDAALGKLDNVLQNQQVMMAQLNKINERLVALAQKMNQQETVNIFNTRNVDFYNKLKVQNIAYFNKAFKLYNDNKSNLGSVKDELYRVPQYGTTFLLRHGHGRHLRRCDIRQVPLGAHGHRRPPELPCQRYVHDCQVSLHDQPLCCLRRWVGHQEGRNLQQLQRAKAKTQGILRV